MDFILGIIVIVICIVGIICILDMIIIGTPFPSKNKKFEESYILKMKNRMDYQKSTECSGFSLAYVLRSYGIDVDGNDVYTRIHRKMKNGAVLPRTLSEVIRKYGFEVKYVRGSVESLKADLCSDKRIIVFIKTRLDKNWLHYVPIVGYDKKYIYIAESMNSLVNCQNENYNRKLTKQEFLKYWDTREVYMPFYKNTYLVIEK